MNRKTKSLLIFLFVVGAFLALVYWTRLGDYVSIERLHAHHDYFARMVREHYLFSALTFVAVYTFFISCAIPVSGPLTLLGSYIFGMIPGFIYALLSCSIGATTSFIIFRYVVRHWVHGWHNARADRFNEQFKKYGASYLLMLHFLSVVPYFVVNVLASLAEVPLKTYVWTVVIGSAPLLFLYSLAAQQLSSIRSIRDILSPQIMVVLGILILLSLLPVIIKKYKKSFDV